MTPPRWLPVTSDGCFWELISRKGKWLGGVIRYADSPLRFLGSKTCCREERTCHSMAEAARFVETTLECQPCGQRVTSEALKVYGKPI